MRRDFFRVQSFVVVLGALLLGAPGLSANKANPCQSIPESKRPPVGWKFDSSVDREWKQIRKTLAEISRLHTGAHSEESTFLKYDLNKLPGAGPIAFQGRIGVESRQFLYFPRGRLACVVVQSKSRPGGSLWDRAYFFVPVEDALRPALEFRGPGKSPFKAFERLELKEQLAFLRQLHRNLRAILYYQERRRAASAGSDKDKNQWALD